MSGTNKALTIARSKFAEMLGVSGNRSNLDLIKRLRVVSVIPQGKPVDKKWSGEFLITAYARLKNKERKV